MVVMNWSGTDDVVRSLAVQPDGKIVAAGDTVVSGHHQIAVARFNADGSLDDGGTGDSTPGDSFGTGGKATASFGTGTDAYGYSLAIQADGEPVVAGYVSGGSFAGTDMAVARFTVTGALDTTFDTDGMASLDWSGANDHAYGLALQPDGKLVLAGDETSSGSAFFAIARLNADGSLDTSFGVVSGSGRMTAFTAGSTAYAVRVDGLGRITAVGANGGDLALARFDSDGTPDDAFGIGGTITTDVGTNDVAHAAALTATGGVVVGGTTGTDFVVGRYETGGTADQRVYVQQDANYNVTSLVVPGPFGGVSERFAYDPYGNSTSMNAGWGTWTDTDWQYRYQGGRLIAAAGLYDFRKRDYSPTLGRWLQNDPAGYTDGQDLYQFERSSPIALLDPSGLASRRRARPDPQVLRDLHITATNEDRDDHCCSVRIYTHWAFGAKIWYHTALDINTPDLYRIELLTAQDGGPGAFPQDLLGTGPAGLFGIPTGVVSDSTDDAIAKTIGGGGGPAKAYGMWMVPNSSFGENTPDVADATPVLPQGAATEKARCQLARRIKAAAELVAAAWHQGQVPYDGLTHNSNTFIGDIVRAAGGRLEFPDAVNRSLAYGPT